MPKGKTEGYSNENTKVSTIETITTTLDTPEHEGLERKTQGENHGYGVESTMIGLYSLRQRAPIVVLGITYEHSW